MGVVIKQSFWSSVWAYLGVIIGFVNTLILRPAFFTESEIGIIGVVTSNALMMAPFMALGMPQTYLRYFPELRDSPEVESKILSLQFYLILFVNFAFFALALVGMDWIEAIYVAESPEYNQFIVVSLVIMVLYSLFSQLHAFSMSKLNVIVPGFLKEVYLRIGNIVLILLFSWQYLTFSQLVYGLIISYATATLILAFFVFRKQKIRLTLNITGIPKVWMKKLLNFGTYNLALAGSNSIYSNISYAMIPAMLGSAANGIYTTCLYIGIIIEMPKRSLLQIIAPVIAKEFKNENYKEIESLYKKASINMGIIGFLALIGITCNLSDLFSIIPNGSSFRTGSFVVIGIAVAKIIDMLFSFNSEVINYSNFYKYNLYFFIITSAITVGLNYTLLPVLGIDGAAIAFIVSTVFFNVIKFVFVKIKFKMSPFTKKHLILFLYSALTFGLFWVLPLTSSPIFNIIVRSLGISVVFMGLMYVSKVSIDINNLIKANIKKYLNITLP